MMELIFLWWILGSVDPVNQGIHLVAWGGLCGPARLLYTSCHRISEHRLFGCFFSNLDAFCLFFFSLNCSKTSNTTLNRNKENRCLWFRLLVWERNLQPFSMEYDVCCGFFPSGFCVRKSPCIFVECWILNFSCVLKWSRDFFSFILLMGWEALTGVCMLNQPWDSYSLLGYV